MTRQVTAPLGLYHAWNTWARLSTVLITIFLLTQPAVSAARRKTAPVARASTLKLGKLNVDLKTLRDAVTADLRQKMEAAVKQGKKQIETSFRSAARQQAQEIYRDFLSWLAERVHKEVYPNLPIDSPLFQKRFAQWAAAPETQIDHYVTRYLEQRAPIFARLLKAYRDEASWEIAGGLEDLWNDAHDKLDRFTKVVQDARKEPNLETTELLRRHGLSGEWMDRFESYEGRFRVFQETMDSYKVVDVTRTVVGAFQTNEPRAKIDALFALLGEVGGVAEESRVPIVSFFGQIAKAYGQLATETLARLDDLSRVLRARQGFCVGTGATNDERQRAFVAHLGSPRKGRWGYLACPTRIPDIYERVDPNDGRIFFWNGHDFLPGRTTGGGVPAVVRAMGFVRDAAALHVPGYAGKEHDMKTIVSVYNVGYASKKFGNGIQGLLAEASATIGGIARREHEVESAFRFGPCSRAAGRAFLASETGLRFSPGVPAVADNVDRLVLQYAAGYLRGHTGAYATYSRIWRSLRDLSILEIRGGVRGSGSCPECAGATLEKTFSGGAREVAGCKERTTDTRARFTLYVATRRLDFSIGLAANAGGHHARRVIVDRRVANLQAVPFVATVSPIWLDLRGGTQGTDTAEATTETASGDAAKPKVPPPFVGRPPSSLPSRPAVPPGRGPGFPPRHSAPGLPNVVGQAAAQAAAAIKKAGFVASMVAGPAPRSRAEQFTIASQDPAAGTALQPGSTVVLRVRGSFVAMATVPDLTGKTRAEAQAVLTAAGLHAAWSNAGAPPGKAQSERVVSQSPAAGLGVDASAPVTVKVYGAWVAPPPPPRAPQPSYKLTPEGCPTRLVVQAIHIPNRSPDRPTTEVVLTLRGIGPPTRHDREISGDEGLTVPCQYAGETATGKSVSGVVDISFATERAPICFPKHFEGERYFASRRFRISASAGFRPPPSMLIQSLESGKAILARVVETVERSGVSPPCVGGNR